MLLGRALKRAAAFCLAVALWAPLAAADDTIGGACPGGADSAQSGNGNNVVCISSVWQYPAYQFGATSGACNSTNAGMAQWTGSGVTPNNTFEFCNGSTWISVSGAAALSSITAATASHTIDSANNAQTWEWGTLSTGTAMTLTTSSMTTGILLDLSSTATGANAGTVLAVTTSEAGASYAIKATNGGAANSGYAGYFNNASTGVNVGVYGLSAAAAGNNNGPYSAGVEGECDNANCNAGVVGTSTSSNGVFGSSSGGVGVLGSSTTGYAIDGHAGFGNANFSVAVHGLDYSTTAQLTEGVHGETMSTNNGSGGDFTITGNNNSGNGVLGRNLGAPNTGYAGYFINTATSGANYGVYGTDASASGFGIYGINSAASGIGIVGEADANNAIGILGQSSSTGGGWGVWGRVTGHGNTGYGGYFTNTDTGNDANYGVYGSDASASGYGGYFTNTSTGWALYASGNANITGSAQVGSTSASCAAGNAGTVQYTSGTLEACNGTSWIPIDSGMHFIATKTASSSASLQFTSLPTSYSTLFLNCAGLITTNTSTLQIIVGEGGTPTWETGAHYTNIVLWTGSGAGSPQQNLSSTATSLINLGSSTSTSTPAQFKGYIDNVNSTSLHKLASFETGNGDSVATSNFYAQSAWGFWNNDVNAVTAIEITVVAGTITSGTCSLYGMN